MNVNTSSPTSVSNINEGSRTRLEKISNNSPDDVNVASEAGYNLHKRNVGSCQEDEVDELVSSAAVEV